MEMGEKIKKYRLLRHMTLEELGQRVGVGKSTVRKWENGMISNMRRDKIDKIARALGVSPGYLMGWTDDPGFVAVTFQSEFENIDQFTTAFNAMNEAREKIADSQEITDSEYQMLRVIYFALTPKNRTRIVGLMQQMLIEQKGGRDDD